MKSKRGVNNNSKTIKRKSIPETHLPFLSLWYLHFHSCTQNTHHHRESQHIQSISNLCHRLLLCHVYTSFAYLKDLSVTSSQTQSTESIKDQVAYPLSNACSATATALSPLSQIFSPRAVQVLPRHQIVVWQRWEFFCFAFESGDETDSVLGVRTEVVESGGCCAECKHLILYPLRPELPFSNDDIACRPKVDLKYLALCNN